MTELEIRAMAGQAVTPHIDDLARLRIEVFREYPYLYDGSLEYEAQYLKSYADSSESLVVLVFHRGDIVGASTGIPLEHAPAEFQAPFLAHGYDPRRIFYLGESVLLKAFRGMGVGVRFFEEREGYANRLGRFEHAAFCAVDRPDHHPRRPPGYVPLDRFWGKRGYRKHPEMTTTFSWRELDETDASPKPMTFWLKPLKEN